jgi:hypothetical protein
VLRLNYVVLELLLADYQVTWIRSDKQELHPKVWKTWLAEKKALKAALLLPHLEQQPN